MTVYRLPFDDDSAWHGGQNWDDPAGGHGPGQAYGYDFRHPVGGSVRAARSGRVVFVENNDGNTKTDDKVPGYGTAILIRHADGTVAAYDHLKFESTKVVEKQYVLQGEIIALSGNTGNSTEPHLHFGVCMFWNAVDDFGPDFPVQFQDKTHVAWRPKNGDPLASNNSTLRQEGWRWCHKCQGLFFGGSPIFGTSEGKCPAGGAHAQDGSANYILVDNSPNAPGQADWRWCNKCQGLFFGGNPGSKCPADGGPHTKTGSGNYSLVEDSFPGQPDWRWCSKCQGLFFAGNLTSVCPAGGAHNLPGWSYVVAQQSFKEGQAGWRWCSKCQGMFFGENPGSMCPAGSEHSKQGSGNYKLRENPVPGELGWRWCNKCQGLFYGKSTGSKCPGGGEHSKQGSGHYSVQRPAPW